MEVTNLIALDGPPKVSDSDVPSTLDVNHGHPYPTRHSLTTNGSLDGRAATPPAAIGPRSAQRSPSAATLKNVSFELQLDGSPNVRGRLPMRVQIFPHDTTESIVTTVKNFYGLYDSGQQSVSFEDIDGRSLIASYENLTNNMTVYVRVLPDPAHHPDVGDSWIYRAHSPQRMNALNDVAPILPQPAQILNYGQPPSRPGSRISRKQSVSPRLSQARIGSSQKSRSRSGIKSQGSSFQAGLDELNGDAHNGYSSSDGGAGSVTSSRKARSEQLATAEISVDNIVEGGRRQKAKFESSELPLFVPPQVPAPHSISSISPQRRSDGLENPSPFAQPLPHALALQPLGQLTPITGANDQAASAPPIVSPFTVPPVPTHGHRLRDRTSGASLSTRSSLGSTHRFYGSNILPTPDPTIASCISDEDVALQLMRLGDVSNFSLGRTSASTLDDGFSGRAEAASSDTSDGASDGDDSDASDVSQTDHYGNNMIGPPLKKQRRNAEGDTVEYNGLERSGDDVDMEHDPRALGKVRGFKPKKSRANGLSIKPPKPAKYFSGSNKPKSASAIPGMTTPISPASLPSSRKTSASALNFQHQLQDDEEDLSSKPRCQRCRKSKKGCDRQRPCGRCKDAGIGIEGCISEDEGNGRKGRYGRHMGVPIKRTMDSPIIDQESEAAGAILSGMVADSFDPNQSKKRKR